MLRYRGNVEAVRNLVRPIEVHRDVYIDDEVFQLEMEHLFANTWVYVGHESQVPDPGDYFGGVAGVNVLIFAPLVAAAATGLMLLARLTRRALAAPPQSGESALVGTHGVAKSAFAPDGAVFTGGVFVDGARWRGISDTAVAEGEPVEVVEVLRSPMRLRVKRGA